MPLSRRMGKGVLDLVEKFDPYGDQAPFPKPEQYQKYDDVLGPKYDLGDYPGADAMGYPDDIQQFMGGNPENMDNYLSMGREFNVGRSPQSAAWRPSDVDEPTIDSSTLNDYGFGEGNQNINYEEDLDEETARLMYELSKVRGE